MKWTMVLFAMQRWMILLVLMKIVAYAQDEGRIEVYIRLPFSHPYFVIFSPLFFRGWEVLWIADGEKESFSVGIPLNLAGVSNPGVH